MGPGVTHPPSPVPASAAIADFPNAVARVVTDPISVDSTWVPVGVCGATFTPTAPPAANPGSRPRRWSTAPAFTMCAGTTSSPRLAMIGTSSAVGPVPAQISPPAAFRPLIPPGYGFVLDVMATDTLTVRPLIPPRDLLTLSRNASNADAAPFSFEPRPGTHPNAAAAPWMIVPTKPPARPSSS